MAVVYRRDARNAGAAAPATPPGKEAEVGGARRRILVFLGMEVPEEGASPSSGIGGRSTGISGRSTLRRGRSTAAAAQSTRPVDPSTRPVDRSPRCVARASRVVDRSTGTVDRSTPSVARSTAIVLHDFPAPRSSRPVSPPKSAPETSPGHHTPPFHAIRCRTLGGRDARRFQAEGLIVSSRGVERVFERHPRMTGRHPSLVYSFAA